MTEDEKEKLRDMNTRLLGFQIRINILIDSLHTEIEKVKKERNFIHNLTEFITEGEKE